MYGANFAYFDPNIWWNEDEMRKQIEQLNGCFVLTGRVIASLVLFLLMHGFYSFSCL